MNRTASDQRTWRSPRCWLLLLVVIAVGLSADLISKQWAFDSVAGTPLDAHTVAGALAELGAGGVGQEDDALETVMAMLEALCGAEHGIDRDMANQYLWEENGIISRAVNRLEAAVGGVI